MTSDTFNIWARVQVALKLTGVRLMNETPAWRIRMEGFTFHGLRASSVEKLREAGCEDRHIEAITGMSPAMISRYSRFADQKRFARAGTGRLEGRTLKERKK